MNSQQNSDFDRPSSKFVVTTDSRHSLPVAPDLVQRRFNPEAPNQICSGDITYIQTNEGFARMDSPGVEVQNSSAPLR